MPYALGFTRKDMGDEKQAIFNKPFIIALIFNLITYQLICLANIIHIDRDFKCG